MLTMPTLEYTILTPAGEESEEEGQPTKPNTYQLLKEFLENDLSDYEGDVPNY